jgi:hypothetical protein
MSQPGGARNPWRPAGRARLALAGGLMAAAMAGAPIAAADTLNTVRGHLRSADATLRQVVVAAGSGRSVKAPLAALEASVRAAGRESSRLYRSAHHSHRPAARLRAATAMTKLAAQDNRDAVALTPLVAGLAPAAGQTDLAVFVASVTQGREQALSLVAPLIGQLPRPVGATFAASVARLSEAGVGQVGQLAGALPAGSIACPGVDAAIQVVVTILASVQTDLTRVQALLSLLPGGAQGQFTAVVGGLPVQLNALAATLAHAFACPATTPVAGRTAGAGSLVSVLGTVGSVVDSVTQLVRSLLASFVPAVGAGHTPSPVAVPPAVSGLLSQVTSLFPELGSLFGANSSSGLPGLGGLPGVAV